VYVKKGLRSSHGKKKWATKIKEKKALTLWRGDTGKKKRPNPIVKERRTWPYIEVKSGRSKASSPGGKRGNRLEWKKERKRGKGKAQPLIKAS